MVQSPQRTWYNHNRQRVLAKRKARYQSNRERENALAKLWRSRNREKVNGYARKHRATHQERCRASARAWYHRNVESQRERSRAKGKQYRSKANPETVRKYKREWCHKNTHRLLHYSEARRALKRGAAINLAQIKEWLALVKSKPFSRCYYCQRKVATTKIHVDHIIPLSKGGAHAVHNLCVSCAPCNLSKQAKTITGWIRIGQQILGL